MEKELFATALGIVEPLFIDSIEFNRGEGELHLHIDFRRGARFVCPVCGETELPVHDTVDKSWRHLNFFQYKCYLHLRNPRVNCPKCGKRLWLPPWARKQSGFTSLFEAFVLRLAREMPILQLAELVGETDTRIWRIVHSHVRRAYKKKTYKLSGKIGVDETSSRKGHNYVTIFADMESGEVLYATEGKDAGTIKSFAGELPKHGADAGQIREVAMDMSPAFIAGVAENLPEASVTYDKFHVVKALNAALDEVRRTEQKHNPLLRKTRYIWLKNPDHLGKTETKLLQTLRHENTKTARVYQMKLTFQDIYGCISEPEAAKAAFVKWLSWAVRSRLEPVKAFARMVKAHFAGILRYFQTKLTSARMEGLNTRIQEIKRRARGFRNIRNFIDMIYLEAGGLDFELPT